MTRAIATKAAAPNAAMTRIQRDFAARAVRRGIAAVVASSYGLVTGAVLEGGNHPDSAGIYMDCGASLLMSSLLRFWLQSRDG